MIIFRDAVILLVYRNPFGAEKTYEQIAFLAGSSGVSRAVGSLPFGYDDLSVISTLQQTASAEQEPLFFFHPMLKVLIWNPGIPGSRLKA